MEGDRADGIYVAKSHDLTPQSGDIGIDAGQWHVQIERLRRQHPVEGIAMHQLEGAGPLCLGERQIQWLKSGANDQPIQIRQQGCSARPLTQLDLDRDLPARYRAENTGSARFSINARWLPLSDGDRVTHQTKMCVSSNKLTGRSRPTTKTIHRR